MYHQDNLILAQTEPGTSFTFNLNFAEGNGAALWGVIFFFFPLVLVVFAAYFNPFRKG